MSLRNAKKPLPVTSGVEVKLENSSIMVKGKVGTLNMELNEGVKVALNDDGLSFVPAEESKFSKAITGTTYALVKNMIIGVSEGFSKTLKLVGVGYRAKTQGNKLELSLGFSHPVFFEVPSSLKVECPSQTEIKLSGMDKQVVGQTAAKIRAIRPPEPYKGKGVKYDDEVIVRKEAKKK